MTAELGHTDTFWSKQQAPAEGGHPGGIYTKTDFAKAPYSLLIEIKNSII
jgi:hypothetical protein